YLFISSSIFIQYLFANLFTFFLHDALPIFPPRALVFTLGNKLSAYSVFNIPILEAIVIYRITFNYVKVFCIKRQGTVFNPTIMLSFFNFISVVKIRDTVYIVFIAFKEKV